MALSQIACGERTYGTATLKAPPWVRHFCLAQHGIVRNELLTSSGRPTQHAALRSRHTLGSVPDGTRGRRYGYRPGTEPALQEQPGEARHRTPGAAGGSRR